MKTPAPPGNLKIVYPCRRCDARGVLGFDRLVCPCPRCGGIGYLVLHDRPRFKAQ